MNVSLTPELERKVDDRVRSGMYGSASEVVREALRLFFRYDDALTREVDDLDRRIGISLAELAAVSASRQRGSTAQPVSHSRAHGAEPERVSVDYVLAPAALGDIDEIADFLAAIDPEAALTVIDAI